MVISDFTKPYKEDISKRNIPFLVAWNDQTNPNRAIYRREFSNSSNSLIIEKRISPKTIHTLMRRTMFVPAPAGNGSLGIGWNFSGGNGEIDFISGRGAGSTINGGGFAFYDLAKSTDTGYATNQNGTLICTMKGHTTTYNSPQLKVEGRLECNDFKNPSDKRLKRDILPIKNALDKILMLNGVTYNWNKEFNPDQNLDDNNHIGLLAQDVEKIIPQIVSTDDSKHQLKSMTYTELIPVLIEAIKEQQTQINELKNKLKDTPYG